MWLYLFRILIIVCLFPCIFHSEWNPDDEWRRLAKRKIPGAVPRQFRNAPDPGYIWLPEFLKVLSTLDQTELFEPATSQQPMPDSLLPILLPTTTVDTPAPLEPRLVEMLCHLDRIYVRIRTDHFNTLNPRRFLTLGDCEVTVETSEYFYFLIMLTTGCNFTYESTEDFLLIKNILHFSPTTIILRDMPFDIPLQCKYHRYIHSYKVGIRPKLYGGTLYKLLRMKRPIIIIPQDGLGNAKFTYNMGETIYFEVKPPSGAVFYPNERLYIRKCYLTPSLMPTSTEKTVIDNYGCMVNGKESDHSKFYAGPPMTQKFSITAGILAEMATMNAQIWQLYIHCEVYIGSNVPSEGRKACNFHRPSNTWTSVYGPDTLCTCCDSVCAPTFRVARTKVTSQPWKVAFGVEDVK